MSANLSKLLPFYWRIVIKPHRWQTLLVLFLILTSAVLQMITIAISVPLLGAVSNPDRASNSSVIAYVTDTLRFMGLSTASNVIILSLLVVACGIFLLRAVIVLCHQYALAVIAHKLRMEIKSLLFERFLRAQYEDLVGKGRGSMLYDINGPSGSVFSSILQLGSLAAGILNVGILIGFLFYLSWWATLFISILAIGGVQGWRRVLDRRAAEYGRCIYELQRDLSKVEVDSFDGLMMVKTHNLEFRMIERQRRILEAELSPRLRLVLCSNTPMFVNELFAILIVLVLGWVTFMVPSVGMHFPMLVAFLMAIRRVSPALASITAATVDLNHSRRGLEILEEVVNQMPPERQGTRRLSGLEELRLADVSFSYASNAKQSVLKGVSLVMKRGTVTAIVGPTGAGKSTMAKLLLGLHRPQSGSILVDNVDLQELDLPEWRKKVGYVSQDIFLFNASILNNISLWDDNISVAEVVSAARLAQLHDFVMGLPDRYETLVGDRGLRLSGGECQRVAVARAILRRARVLIFDEATSALDNLTEELVYTAIDSLRKDTIVIVIAHRLSTIRNTDQITVLSSGQVIEVGTHDSLMGMGGVYAALYGVDGHKSTEDESRGSVLQNAPDSS